MKDFEIIGRDSNQKFLELTSECAIKLRCPFCKSEFTGHESSGCFHHLILPFDCLSLWISRKHYPGVNRETQKNKEIIKTYE
jgi:hypothetical protein